MAKRFKRGDRVEWNSEAGRVRGIILKKVVSDVRVKGYVHHASKDEPQYLIKSEKTDHIAIHKGRALKRVKVRAGKQRQERGAAGGARDRLQFLSSCVLDCELLIRKLFRRNRLFGFDPLRRNLTFFVGPIHNEGGNKTTSF
jgi:Hypervirulence associated proteins TUDOR domain